MVNLIPAPLHCENLSGTFSLDDSLKVKSDFDLPLLKLQREESGKLIIKKDTSLSPESYTLDIAQDGIKICANDEAGAYYALQSLRQISRYELGQRTVACCKIKDKPRFKWRGLQLDEARHFFGKEKVKELLDFMFFMKLNVFHWHLTDDQGWRIEIKKYPLLTEIGSTRSSTHINGWGSTEIQHGIHSGFYTQEDIKEIIEYAEKRNITIVPEIDFPAHCAAAIAAYPWLACREIKRGVAYYFGSSIPEKILKIKDWNRTICAGKSKSVEFVFDVIDEVCDLFPSKYFHIGGDEAPKDEWKKCPHCQKVIKDNNLKNEEGLQGYFNNLILEHLKKKGKRLIGWNEILKAHNIDKSVVAQYWTPQKDKNAQKHANSGYDIIMSNHKSFYFDIPYAQYPLKNTYNFKTETYGISSLNAPNILGVEGENWTEWTNCTEKLQMKLHPRMEALAEVAWSDNSLRNWKDFKHRLESFKDYYDYFNINYAVDKISQSKNIFHRARAKKLFFKGDTDYEFKLNKEYRKQGLR